MNKYSLMSFWLQFKQSLHLTFDIGSYSGHKRNLSVITSGHTILRDLWMTFWPEFIREVILWPFSVARVIILRCEWNMAATVIHQIKHDSRLLWAE